MITETTKYVTSDGRSFDKREEAVAHELGGSIDDAFCKLLQKKSDYDYGELTLNSAAHQLAIGHPEIARRVLDALSQETTAKDEQE